MHTSLAPRRRLWRVAAPLAVAAITTAGCFGGGAGGDVGTLLQRVNEVRASAGLPALTWCPTLANAATRHATDMEVHGIHGHVGHDGSTFDQRIHQAGYLPGILIAENVAWGQTTVEQVLGDWLNSTTGHRENILNPGLVHAGFARVGNNWVQNFGTGGAC